MKKEDVPQQPHHIYEGEKKVVYAVNQEGKLEIAQTSGWEVESAVLEQALEEINRLAQEALIRALAGESSPLEYHMYAQRMDLPMLAQAVGRFQWQVRRHFKPRYFSNLNPSQIELYARVLGIDTTTLMQLPDA